MKRLNPYVSLWQEKDMLVLGADSYDLMILLQTLLKDQYQITYSYHTVIAKNDLMKENFRIYFEGHAQDDLVNAVNSIEEEKILQAVRNSSAKAAKLNKKVSGNFIDRLLIGVLPFVLVTFILLYWLYKNDLSVVFILLLALFYWLIDTLVILFKFGKPQSLYVNDYGLVLGGKQIQISSISRIREVSNSAKWSITMIEITLINDEKWMFIPKLDIFPFFGKKYTATIREILQFYPSLEAKTGTNARL